MNITPLHDRVIVEPIEIEKVSKGGIIIPDTVKEKPIRGKVIAAGRGKKDEPLTVKKDDMVLYSKYAGSKENEIKVDDKTYLIMKESDILAII